MRPRLASMSAHRRRKWFPDGAVPGKDPFGGNVSVSLEISGQQLC